VIEIQSCGKAEENKWAKKNDLLIYCCKQLRQMQAKVGKTTQKAEISQEKNKSEK
jgi:hypothetical protein